MPMPGVGSALPISSGTMRFTTLVGIAKPMPALASEGEKIAVLTPMRRPAESRSGPPELPGLIAASVWMTSASSRSSVSAGRLQRADDAGGEGLVEAERIADGEGPLPDLEIVRIAEGRRAGRELPPDAQHRQIVAGGAPDQLGAVDVAARHAHGNAAGALHHVVVGDDMAGIVPDETVAQRPGRRGCRRRPTTDGATVWNRVIAVCSAGASCRAV